MRRSTALLLISLLIGYTIGLAIWTSSRHPMVLDEFFAYDLLSDRSFLHAVGSWNRGADSGGILYYVLLWPVVNLSHGSVLAARLFSSVCYLAAGIVWWKALSCFMNSKAAAMGVLLVWSTSGLLLVYMSQVRFYAPLLLFASLAVWTTLRCSREDVPPLRAATLIFAAHASLVLVHMLGVLYSAFLLIPVVFCLAQRRRSVVLTAAIVAAWLTLVPCHTAIHNGSLNATYQPIPVFRDVLRCYLKASTFVPVLAMSFLGLAWVLRSFVSRLFSEGLRARYQYFGPVLCLAFGAGPFSLYLISHLGRPLGEARYILPYYLCLCTLCSFGLAALQSLSRDRFVGALLAGCLALAVCLHSLALKSLPPPIDLQVGDLQSVAAGGPVVVADEQAFFNLQYYRSGDELQFHFLLPPEKSRPVGMMATVAERGYFPKSFDHVDRFRNEHKRFFFIASVVPGKPALVMLDRSCQTHRVASVVVSGIEDAVLDVRGCPPAR